MHYTKDCFRSRAKFKAYKKFRTVKLLQPIVLPFIGANQDTLLQQDIARHYAARPTQNFLATMSKLYHGLCYRLI